MSQPLSNPNSKASRNYKARHNAHSNSKNQNKRKKPNKKSKKFKKKFSHKNAQITREEIEAPKSFVIIRGRVTKYCKFLRDDIRLMFSPYTAAKLQEKQSNSLKDFIHSSTEFGVTHLITLSQSDIAGTMLRMIRLPKGPTFWFQIKEYSLIQNIIKMQYQTNNNINNKKWHQMKYNKSSQFLPKHIQFAFRFAPLVILNGFSKQTNPKNLKKNVSNSENNIDSENVVTFNRTSLYHKQLMSVMFKHMFCPINIVSMKLNQCKRVVFFNYNCDNDSVQIRHYKIQIANDLKGVSKGIKKIIKGDRKMRGKIDGKYPDLGGYEDIRDYVVSNKDACVSDSEVEDDEYTRVCVDRIKNMRKASMGSDSNYVRLKEIGPRIDMELVKIEEMINDGKVLYHRYISKSEREVKELQARKEKERLVKEQRRVRQAVNVQRKVDLKQDKRDRRVEERKKREVEKLLKSFDLSDGSDGSDGDVDCEESVGEKRGILKRGKDGQTRKKRKLNTNKKRVRFDS